MFHLSLLHCEKWDLKQPHNFENFLFWFIDQIQNFSFFLYVTIGGVVNIFLRTRSSCMLSQYFICRFLNPFMHRLKWSAKHLVKSFNCFSSLASVCLGGFFGGFFLGGGSFFNTFNAFLCRKKKFNGKPVFLLVKWAAIYLVSHLKSYIENYNPFLK